MVAGTSLLQSILGITTASKSLTNLTALFGPSLSPGAQIISSTDTNFTARLTQRWTDYNAPSYIGAIKPVTETDVQNIVSMSWEISRLSTDSGFQVKIAAANEIPFLTTGGGHGIADYHAFNGLSIDMSHFNSVHLNPLGNRLSVGGSVRISQLINLLYDAEKELRMFSCVQSWILLIEYNYS